MQYYGWSFGESEVHCGHVYNCAEDTLEHMANAGHLFLEAAKLSDARLTIQGPDEELAKIRGPLAGFKWAAGDGSDRVPEFFVRRYGFRR